MRTDLKRWAIYLAASAALAGAARAQFAYDLTIPNVSAQINYNGHTAFFFLQTSESATGTGVYNTFVQLQDGNDADSAEHGYNGSSPRMPDVGSSGQSNKLVQFSDLTVPSNNPVNGVTYWSVGLDINESGSDEFISLDKFQVYIRSSPLANHNSLLSLTSGATLVYDMDQGSLGNASILMNYLLSSSGSGRADLLVLLPQSITNGISGINSSWYFYLYTELGSYGSIGSSNFGAAAGFEEWQTVSGLSFFPPPIVPEAGTWAALGFGGLALGYVWRRQSHARKG